MPRHPPKPNSEPPQTRPNNHHSSRNFRHYSRPSKRTSRPATAFAALAVLASVSPTPSCASPVPIPFLEFLYPSFLSSCSSPATPTSTRRWAQQPPREPKDAVASRKSRNKEKRTASHSNVLSKRSADSILNVPVKYESGDAGWAIAESWDLHGRHRRAQTTTTADPVGPTNIQNLDAADTGNGGTHATDPLELPYGWDTHGQARHESYDPVIVSVFAVVLVFAIVVTIGLCRWRTKKERRLRDLERLEQEQKSDASSDTSSIINEKPGKTTRKKIRNSVGKSTGFKRMGDRLTARIRRKRRAKNNTVRPGDEIQNHQDEPATTRDLSVVASRHEAKDSTNEPAFEAPNRRSLDSSAPVENSDRRSISSNNTRAAVHDATVSELHPQPLQSQPPPSPSQPPPLTTAETEGITPIALPPAYRSSSAIRVRAGKAPIRGFEEDYDERSLTGYRRLQDLPQARRASTSQFSHTTSAAPPFEQFEQPHGAEEFSVEIGNGATRRAHVATDDKAILERMRRLANEPSIYSTHPHAPGPGTSSPTSLRPSDPILPDPDTAQVPAWSELDEFDTEQQLRAHRQSSIVDNMQTTSPGINPIGPHPSDDTSTMPSDTRRLGAALHLPPPPSPSTFIPATLRGTGDEEDYGFGHVWTGLGATDPTALTHTAEVSSLPRPSAPPSLVDDPSLGPSIVPSAPPFEASAPELPSAPPAWDEDLDTEVPNEFHDDSSGSPPASSSVASTSAGTSTPSSAEANSVHTDQSAGPSSDNARWSLTLGTRAEEGAGLPRYEP